MYKSEPVKIKQHLKMYKIAATTISKGREMQGRFGNVGMVMGSTSKNVPRWF